MTTPASTPALENHIPEDRISENRALSDSLSDLGNRPSKTDLSKPDSPEPNSTHQPDRSLLKSFSPQVLAQALAEQLAIAPNDWHKLSANRAVRAQEQAAAALVYMLKDKPEEALPRLQQAVGWLDRTLKAPPCPTHGEKKDKSPIDALTEN